VPWDIYKDPVNLFVATFVGKINALDVLLGESMPSGMRKATAGSIVFAVPAAGTEDYVEAVLAFRPEDIVETTSDANANRLAGVLKATSFLGTVASMELDLSGQSIVIERHRPKKADIPASRRNSRVRDSDRSLSALRQEIGAPPGFKGALMSLVKKKADIWSLVTFAGFAIVVIFLIYPLFDVFRYSFVDKETGAASLSNWKEFFGRAYYMRAFGHSMFIALVTTFFSALLGIPLAFFTTRYKIRGSNLLNTLSVLALLSPTFIGAYSWITMMGRNGFLRNIFVSIGINLPQIYGPLGIILADSLQYYPFISLMLAGSLMTIDRSLEEASENLGARSFKTFFSVTIPLVLPSLTGGALIVFMMSLSNFGTPMIIGGNYLVLPTLAYNMFTSEVGESPGMASTVSIILMMCAAVVIVLQTWASSRRKYASMLVNRPVQKSLKGIKSFLAHLVCYFIVGLSTLPLGVIVFYSFRNTSGPVFKPGFGLDSYRQYFLRRRQDGDQQLRVFLRRGDPDRLRGNPDRLRHRPQAEHGCQDPRSPPHDPLHRSGNGAWHWLYRGLQQEASLPRRNGHHHHPDLFHQATPVLGAVGGFHPEADRSRPRGGGHQPGLLSGAHLQDDHASPS